MIVYSDGSWECGADETSIPEGAMRYDDGSDIAQTIRQYDRVSITDGIVKAISDRQGEIAAELDSLDLKAVRPLRAIAAGTANEQDRSILVDIETKAKELRKELSEIINAE